MGQCPLSAEMHISTLPRLIVTQIIGRFNCRVHTCMAARRMNLQNFGYGLLGRVCGMVHIYFQLIRLSVVFIFSVFLTIINIKASQVSTIKCGWQSHRKTCRQPYYYASKCMEGPHVVASNSFFFSLSILISWQRCAFSCDVIETYGGSFTFWSAAIRLICCGVFSTYINWIIIYAVRCVLANGKKVNEPLHWRRYDVYVTR